MLLRVCCRKHDVVLLFACPSICSLVGRLSVCLSLQLAVLSHLLLLPGLCVIIILFVVRLFGANVMALIADAYSSISLSHLFIFRLKMDSEPNLKADGVILRNLKGAMYKMGVHPITARVTSLVSSDDIVVVGTIGYGCQLFR